MTQSLKKPVLLVIEDDATTAGLISQSAVKAGYLPVVCRDLAAAREADWEKASAVLLDLELPDGDGLDLLSQSKRSWPNLPFFILTSRDKAESAVLALKAGATDYFIKPVEPPQLFSSIAGAIDKVAVPTNKKNSTLLDWKGSIMTELYGEARKAADAEGGVLLLGEQGTGKRTLAQFIHSRSRRAPQHFVALDLGSLDDEAATTELFGGEVRSSSGRLVRLRGKIEMANGGTLYIQDIDLLPLRLQSRLMDALEIRPESGSSNRSDFRLIASSQHDLRQNVDAGTFRTDLYYRLSSRELSVPTLREAIEDLPVWCSRILTEICLVHRCGLPVLTRAAREALIDYTWPGNLDELRRELERAVGVCGGGVIGVNDLSDTIASAEARGHRLVDPGSHGVATIRDMERKSLVATLAACEGNRRRAAKRLGVSLRTIYNMIGRHGLGTRTGGSGSDA